MNSSEFLLKICRKNQFRSIVFNTTRSFQLNSTIALGCWMETASIVPLSITRSKDASSYLGWVLNTSFYKWEHAITVRWTIRFSEKKKKVWAEAEVAGDVIFVASIVSHLRNTCWAEQLVLIITPRNRRILPRSAYHWLDIDVILLLENLFIEPSLIFVFKNR